MLKLQKLEKKLEKVISNINKYKQILNEICGIEQITEDENSSLKFRKIEINFDMAKQMTNINDKLKKLYTKSDKLKNKIAEIKKIEDSKTEDSKIFDFFYNNLEEDITIKLVFKDLNLETNISINDILMNNELEIDTLSEKMKNLFRVLVNKTSNPDLGTLSK